MLIYITESSQYNTYGILPIYIYNSFLSYDIQKNKQGQQIIVFNSQLYGCLQNVKATCLNENNCTIQLTYFLFYANLLPSYLVHRLFIIAIYYVLQGVYKYFKCNLLGIKLNTFQLYCKPNIQVQVCIYVTQIHTMVAKLNL